MQLQVVPAAEGGRDMSALFCEKESPPGSCAVSHWLPGDQQHLQVTLLCVSSHSYPLKSFQPDVQEIVRLHFWLAEQRSTHVGLRLSAWEVNKYFCTCSVYR